MFKKITIAFAATLITLEELAFGFAFGLYWAGIYEHFTWHRGQSNREAEYAS